VPRIEARVTLAIEPQELLDLDEGCLPRRGPTAPTVQQAEVAIPRKTRAVGADYAACSR